MTQVSKRIQYIANEVPVGVRTADIGTDHGFLPIYLAENKNTPRLIASDIRPGPLNAARRNIQVAGLEALIETRLGSGLTTVEPGEVDAAVIAGMGGKTIMEILVESEKIVDTLKCLVLQPMGASRLVRKYLHTRHFHIQHETVFYDGDRMYELITAVPVALHALGQPVDQLAEHIADDYTGYTDSLSLNLAYEFGPYLLRKPTPAFIDAVRVSLRRWKVSAEGMENASSEAALQQKEWIRQRIAWMEKWLKEKSDRKGCST